MGVFAISDGGLKESDVDSFVDDVLVNDKPWASGVQEALTGSHVFVCAHGSRDNRCGVCGPVLIDKFKEEAELRGLTNQVFVTACSHIGGHMYAGNLIIYSPGLDGSITGHWYGYVTPDDVPELLDQHIGKGDFGGAKWEYLLMKLKKLMTRSFQMEEKVRKSRRSQKKTAIRFRKMRTFQAVAKVLIVMDLHDAKK